MKRIFMLLILFVTIIGCNDSGSDDPTYTMSISHYFPMEYWGQYSTQLDISTFNDATLSRIYTSVSLDQLTAYGEKLKTDNFKEYRSEKGINGFIKSTGQQGFGWGYEQYPDGKYLVFWRTTYIQGTPDVIDTWPSSFSYFPKPPEKGYTYIQTGKNIVRMYPAMTSLAVSNYTAALIKKGFKWTLSATGTPAYIYKDTARMYVWVQQKIPLAQSNIYTFQWMTEEIK